MFVANYLFFDLFNLFIFLSLFILFILFTYLFIFLIIIFITFLLLPICSIQGLSYTLLVLCLYLYLSNLAIRCCTFVAIITSSFGPFQISILFWAKLYFVLFRPQISSLSFSSQGLIFSICFLQFVHQFIYCNEVASFSSLEMLSVTFLIISSFFLSLFYIIAGLASCLLFGIGF